MMDKMRSPNKWTAAVLFYLEFVILRKKWQTMSLGVCVCVCVNFTCQPSRTVRVTLLIRFPTSQTKLFTTTSRWDQVGKGRTEHLTSHLTRC